MVAEKLTEPNCLRRRNRNRSVRKDPKADNVMYTIAHFVGYMSLPTDKIILQITIYIPFLADNMTSWTLPRAIAAELTPRQKQTLSRLRDGGIKPGIYRLTSQSRDS